MTRSRRKFLASSLSFGGVSVAGCLDLLDEEEEEPSPSGSSDPGTATSDDTETATGTQESSSQEREERTDYSHLWSLSGNTSPEIEEPVNYYDRHYTWTAVNRVWEFNMSIPKPLESYYDERLRIENRGQFVSDPYDDQYIESMASEFERLGRKHDLRSRQVVDLAMAFVQQLEYTSDQVASGYSQYTYYPVQTLIDRGGDCEDTVILLASILREMGYGAVLLLFWDENHMALGIKGDDSIPGTYYEYQGDRYYYVETTGEGWQVGQVPSPVEGAQAEIQQIRGYPTLVYSWATTLNQESNDLKIDFTIRNVGDRTASDVKIAATFETTSGNTVAQQEKHIGQLSRDQSNNESLLLSPPDDRRLKCTTYALIGDTVHDKQETEFKDPNS